MTDILKTDLEVNDRAALEKIDRFYSKLRETATGIDNLGKNSTFAAEFTRKLTDVSRQAEKTRASFAGIVRFDTSNNSLDGLSKAAIRLENESQKVARRLRDIKAINTTGKSESFLKIIADDAETAERRLVQLERRAEQLQNRRASRPSVLSGAGGGRGGGRGGRGGRITDAQATGLELIDDFAPDGLNRPFNAVARAIMPQITAFASSALFAPAILAAAGAGIIYKITKDIRDEAETRLKLENAITGAINNQLIAQKTAMQNQATLRANAESDFNFNQRLQSNRVDDLRRERDLLLELNKNLPVSTLNAKGERVDNPAFQRNTERILQLENQIRQNALTKRADENASFAQRNEDFKRNQADAAEFQRRRAEDFTRSVQAGKVKLGELQKQNETLFSSLYAQSGAGNPFVAVFSEADRAIETVKLTTAGLRAELQATALGLQQSANAANLFNARLDTGLQALSLRDDAARFRADRQTVSTANLRFSDDEIRAGAARFAASANPLNRNLNIDTLSPSQRQELFEAQLFSDTPENQRGGLVALFARQRRESGAENADAAANLSVQERLQKQIDFVNSLGAKTDAEKSLADRRIIALTQGLRPGDLTDAQNRAAATARENEARRLEQAETAANLNRAEQAATLKSLDNNFSELLKIAKSDGLVGVIRIINEADDRARVELGKRPTDRSTEAMTR